MHTTTFCDSQQAIDSANHRLYNEHEVRQMTATALKAASKAAEQTISQHIAKMSGPAKLDKCISGTTDKKGEDDMSVERRKVIISYNDDGSPVYKWLKANNQDEMNDKIVQEYISSGLIWKLLDPASIHAPDSQITANMITFEAYTDKWMKLYKENTCKISTVVKYTTDLNSQILPYFGKKPINSITTNDIQDFLNERKDKAAKSLKGYKALIKQILDSALEDHLITENPADSQRIHIPSHKKAERKALPLQEFKRILSQADCLNPSDRSFLVLLMFTGMRRGEALGLRWEDIDTTNNLIHIRRSVTHATGNHPIIGTTKTEKGMRDIPLDPYLLDVLKPLQSKGFIIGGEQPITMTTYNNTWRRIKKQIDLCGATPHVLRHSYLTYLHSAGASDKTLQTIAGHSQIGTTMNIYVHATSDDVTKAGKTMHEILCA